MRDVMMKIEITLSVNVDQIYGAVSKQTHASRVSETRVFFADGKNN